MPHHLSAEAFARCAVFRGYDPTLQPFDGDHVIVPWVVARALDSFLGPPPG